MSRDFGAICFGLVVGWVAAVTLDGCAISALEHKVAKIEAQPPQIVYQLTKVTWNRKVVGWQDAPDILLPNPRSPQFDIVCKKLHFDPKTFREAIEKP